MNVTTVVTHLLWNQVQVSLSYLQCTHYMLFHLFALFSYCLPVPVESRESLSMPTMYFGRMDRAITLS